jgi:Uma2 family endonuclease
MPDTAASLPRMTADEFLTWYEEQPEGQHYELIDGVVYAQAAERVSHALLKGLVYRRLFEAVGRRALPCTVIPDGVALRIDDEVFEPDCIVRCGAALPADALFVVDPVIVVEVRSPSTHNIDSGIKLQSYFRFPSLQHYLLLRPDRPMAVHYYRQDDASIGARIVASEPILLDPPGIELCDWWPDN